MIDEVYERQYKKMTETPVWKLVVRLAVPSTISVLITNIYNLADTYFVSGIGVYESGATGIVYSLMAIIQAIGYMFGSGAGSCISRLLGAGRTEEAKKICATIFYVGIAFGVAFSVFGILFIEPFMYLLGSTPLILPSASAYGFYILIAVPAMVGSFILNNVFRYEGKAVYGMLGLTSGGVLNIFLDYYLIRKVGMGIAGAGIATCVSQYIALGVLIGTFALGKSQVSVRIRYFTPDIRMIVRTTFVGFPSLVRQGLFGLSAATMNHCAAMVGNEHAIAAMSIVSRVMNLFYCLAIGIGQGYQPVCGYNYGAGKYDRVKKAMIFMMIFTFVTLGTVVTIGFINADGIISLFRSDPEIISLGAAAMRAQCIAMPFLAFQICANMSYQSLGFAVHASVLASFRSGLFFIPVVIIGTKLFVSNGLIYAEAVSDFIGTAASIPFIVAMVRRLSRPPKSA